MKKGLLLGAVVIAASFASCKKDYACRCTNNSGTLSVTGSEFEATRKAAKDKCTAQSTSYSTCEAVKK